MAGYLVPITLLVLTSFTLGLLVGRLLWASSHAPTYREPEEPEPQDPQAHDDEPEARDVKPEAGSTSVRRPSGRLTEDPPVWQMTEVDPPQHPDAVAVSVEVDQGDRTGGAT